MFNRCSGVARENEVTQNFTADNMNVDVDIDFNNQQMMGGMMPAMPAMGQNPIMEPIQERQVHRTIMHEVPHVCPIRTRIVNHHVYRHTYQPSYSCCEENTCSTINCGSCCKFR